LTQSADKQPNNKPPKLSNNGAGPRKGSAFFLIRAPEMTESPLTYSDIKELAARLQRPAATLIAGSDATDPFYITPGRVEWAHWFAMVWAFLDPPPGVHLRRLFYQLVSRADEAPRTLAGHAFENTDRNWTLLCSAAADARHLKLVDANMFTDQRAGPPVFVFEPSDINTEAERSVARAARPEAEPLPELIYESAEYEFPDPPAVDFVAPLVAEPYALEIWIEKSTMNDVLLPIAEQHGLTLVSGVGDLSDTHCNWFIERTREHGRKARILYISDFDPSGSRMPVSVACKIQHKLCRDGFDLDIRLEPLALTAKQVRQYRLPRVPIKDSDRSRARFEALNGEGAVELDALEALHPGVLARLVSRTIDKYRAPAREARAEIRTIMGELREAAAAAREEVLAEHAEALTQLEADFEAMQEAIAPHQEALAAIAAEVERRSAEHTEAINEHVAAFYDRAESVYAGIAEALEAAAPDLDAVDWPEIGDANETDVPLFDSARDYVTQVDRFKRHLGKPTGRARRNGGAS
jgi:hypothetical protein